MSTLLIPGRLRLIGGLSLALGVFLTTACDDKVPEPSTVERKTALTATAPPKDVTGGITELKKEDIKEGTGPEVKDGDTVSVHYTGTLLDGTKFDSSKDRNEPFEFTVGKSSVIKGWHEGLVGMKKGGTRKLTIPASKGYGKAGSPPTIPPNATLVFEIELLEIK
ncbi:MAG: FKBP-type peptidyl-prolyl cis-trans isomerase [Polyangiaceae bacterium]